MIEITVMARGEGSLVWGRLCGSWGACEWQRLAGLLGHLAIPAGGRIVLDLSTAQLHFRGVPTLLALGHAIEERELRLTVTGLSDRLRWVLELGGALAGREFVERHALGDSPLPGPADSRDVWREIHAPLPRGPHGRAVASLN